jgi:Holliday junction resolvase-like predicted endonuclease
LIARRGEWLILVEVRCRRGTRYGLPVQTVRGRKTRALGRAGRAYIGRHRGDARCWRFDVVTVTIGPDGDAGISHYPNAVPL